MASDLVQQLLEFGEVRRGALGIAAQPLTARLADALDVPVRYGVIVGAVQGATLTEQTLRNGRRFLLIENVQADSQLGRAGVQDGDIILSVNRQGVGTLRDLQAIVRASGNELLVLLQRGRATLYVSLQKE